LWREAWITPAGDRHKPLRKLIFRRLQNSIGGTKLTELKQQHRRVRRAITAAATLASLAAAEASSVAFATNTDDSASDSKNSTAQGGWRALLEEVTVTARKREEKAIDVPFSLLVLDSGELGSDLAATGVAAVGDSVPAVPKVSTSGFAEWGTSFAADGRAYVRGDVSYITTRYGSFATTEPIRLRPYALGNIRFGVEGTVQHVAFRHCGTTSTFRAPSGSRFPQVLT
jgi:outer membrane receptor protein involved in Fe transport